MAPATSPGSATVRQALEAGQGVLRLAPTWVPRSFLTPGRRIKLHPNDVYAYGAHRGGIDERWFASTTPAANEGRVPDEGLSYVVHNGQRAFTLADAITLEGQRFIGKAMCLLMDMDAMLGGDFEKGLTSMKAVVEAEQLAVE